MLGKYRSVLCIFSNPSLLNFNASCILIYQESPETFLILSRSITPFFSEVKFRLLSLLIRAFHSLVLPCLSTLISFKETLVFPQCFPKVPCFFQPSSCCSLSCPFSNAVRRLFSTFPAQACLFQLVFFLHESLPHPPPLAHSCIFLPSLPFVKQSVSKMNHFYYICWFWCSPHACMQGIIFKK